MKFISANKGLRVLFYSLILASFSTSALAWAHASPNGKAVFQQTISGTVRDSSGPLPGVIISVKGTARSVVTDQDGKFSIVASNYELLVFSFTGYKTVEVIIGAQSILNILLQEDATQLEELEINAGYYSVKQKESTGSITRITAKDIEAQPVTNVLAAMQGRMSGVSITQSTGVPGGGFDIKIRGTNSLRADGNSPLYIVDGMPYYANAFSSTSNSGSILPGAGSNPLNSLNPLDIENIEILKDADATSIYGSRGANGVVLITTKKGKTGKTVFKADTYTAMGTITKTTKMLNTAQYLNIRRQAFANDGFSEYPDYAYDVNGTWDQNRDTDWQDELIGGTSVINSLQTAVSGGNEYTQFMVSNTIYKETTVFPGDFSFKKAAINFNLNHSSADRRFSIALSGNYLADRNNLPATDLTRQALTLAPNAPSLYTSDGSLNWENSTWVNPLAALSEGYEAKNKILIANTSLRYLLLENLELKATLGYTDNRYTETRVTPSTIYNPAYGFGSEFSTYARNNIEASSWNFEPQISYNYSHGQGRLQALAGMTFLERISLQDGLFARGFSSNSLINNPAASSFVRAMPTNDITYRYNAIFTRINYDWEGRYFINLTGRRDGSSRFGPGKRFANFGAIGAAWLFGKEQWLSNVSWLSFGKLRGSYGTTGNDQIGDYQFLNLYGTSGYRYDNIPGIQPLRLFNPNFSWETNKKLEAALELGFLKDRIFFSAAWYRNRSSDQLVGIPLPGTTGFATIQANLDAVVQNTGLEFELKFQPLKDKNFDWQTNINLTVPRTKLISFPGLEGSTYAQQYIVGQPLDVMQLYHFEGVDPQTGVYRFRDYNNDGILSPESDRKAFTSRSPRLFAGFQNSIQFKNWKLDFLLQFVKQAGTKSAYLGTLPGSFANLAQESGTVWTGTGQQAQIQAYTTGFNNDAVNSFYQYVGSDAVFTDASYLRLKNISLTYTLPESLHLGINCQVYAQAQNLLTFTKYKYADPETQFSGYLPPLRIISLGARLTF
jgi:TonB-dependent starch-binding outer membrane protein SusC